MKKFLDFLEKYVKDNNIHWHPLYKGKHPLTKSDTEVNVDWDEAREVAHAIKNKGSK